MPLWRREKLAWLGAGSKVLVLTCPRAGAGERMSATATARTMELMVFLLMRFSLRAGQIAGPDYERSTKLRMLKVA